MLLEVEAGYDGNFNAPDLTRDQSATLTAVLTPTSYLAVQADFDVWAASRAPQQRSHGHGDTHLSVQSTLRAARPGQVGVGMAYDVKLPTARPDTLGSGRVDHRLIALLSFSSRRFTIDVAAGIDANGRPAGLDWGAEGGVTLTIPVFPEAATHVAWSGQTVDTDQPAGHYASGGITWQLNPLLALDIGGRTGLSSGAPSFGLTAGLSVAVVRP